MFSCVLAHNGNFLRLSMKALILIYMLLKTFSLGVLEKFEGHLYDQNTLVLPNFKATYLAGNTNISCEVPC